MKKSLWLGLSLLFSSSTLICCGLPIILVSMGLGATFVWLTSQMPWLITLSEHASLLFIIALICLIFSGIWIQRQATHCPIDPIQRAACQRMLTINRVTWWISLSLMLAGFFFKYILQYLVY